MFHFQTYFCKFKKFLAYAKSKIFNFSKFLCKEKIENFKNLHHTLSFLCNIGKLEAQLYNTLYSLSEEASPK